MVESEVVTLKVETKRSIVAKIKVTGKEISSYSLSNFPIIFFYSPSS